MKACNPFYLLAFMLIPVSAISQGEGLVWHFGGNCVLDFTTSPPTLDSGLDISSINGSEGTASICDANGNTLFYSNGFDVWGSDNQQMPSFNAWPDSPIGIPLLGGGLSATHSALIVPNPGNSNLYYLFGVAEEIGYNGFSQQLGLSGVSYVEIDMSANNGNGDVISNIVEIETTTTEKLAVTNHCNGQDYWVMGHDFQSNTFYAWLINEDGVQPPVISNVGYSHDCPIGQMKFSPDGKKIACATYGFFSLDGNVTFEVLDFDNATGQVSNSILFDNDFPSVPGVNTQGLYGVSFSPNSQLVYAGFFNYYEFDGSESILYQYQVGDDVADPLSTKLIIAEVPSGLGALQLGPDCRIYASTFNIEYLSVIENPNEIGAACNFNFQGIAFETPPNIGSLGLPTVNESWYFPFCNEIPSETLTIAVQDTCVNSNTRFDITDDVIPNNVIWNFGDPNSGAQNTAEGPMVQHIYSTPGNYEVEIFFEINCQSFTQTRIVEIIDGIALNSSFDVVETICTDSLLVEVNFAENSTPNGLFTIDPPLPFDETNATVSIANALPGDYLFEYQVSDELCNQTDSTQVFVTIQDCSIDESEDQCYVFIPNCITADNDGINDYFSASLSCEPYKYELRIFNRWGDEVFASTDTRQPWVGNNITQYVPDGVYVYRLELEFVPSEIQTFQGHVLVIR